MSGWDENLLNAYLDGELDDAQARAVERLLATDPEARREFAAMRGGTKEANNTP